MTTEETLYDVVLLGGGTGGYVSAIRAAQLGLKVAVVERHKVGGTCLHKGCMPSKALLRTAEVYALAKRADEFGVETVGLSVSWSKALARKDDIVQTLHAGVQGLLRKNKVTVVEGSGRLAEPSGGSIEHGCYWTVETEGRAVRARNVVLSTGSRPATMGLPLDERTIMTSDQALERAALPKSVLIVGGGSIGLEWASLYADCGAEVTIVEALPRLMALEEEDVSEEIRKLFVRKGIRVLTSTKVDVAGVMGSRSNVIVPVTKENGSRTTLMAEALLLSVGRLPNVEDIGIDGLPIERSGPYLKVNGYQETGVPGLYAIGDICGGGLAHVAAEQGIIAAERIAGLEPKPYDSNVIPKCTYTRPEIASVGLTEQAAREAGFDVQAGKFPFRAIGKSLIYGEYEGFAKLVVDRSDGKVLGAHLIGPHATDLIAEPGLLVAGGMNLSELVHATHAHPTLAEAFKEAGLAVMGRAIHY
ncbi:dihydrolipoyl dehydrogenase [Cohnella nanjingensis]|uniref:Dihydrolipoyl dehydrogenase n=1 Tax=Cohnella nanjingensis TaxID=1387779 RepID=A0A7X0VEI8_9BACL|nr:dihydrolipoyl dehydrogenase [Cohnella nanjingensis]MBB6670781.1 dihydrolipoyl dehydrogenase [Cohnella nanjingensis]